MESIIHTIQSIKIISILSFILFVGLYLIYAFGIRKVLKFYHYKKLWVAFIPIVNLMAMAKCMKADADGNVKVFGKSIPKKIFVWFPLVQWLIGFIPKIGSFLSFAILTIGLAHTYKDLLERADKKTKYLQVLAWISGIFGIVWLVLCYTKFKENGKEIVME